MGEKDGQIQMLQVLAEHFEDYRMVGEKLCETTAVMKNVSASLADWHEKVVEQFEKNVAPVLDVFARATARLVAIEKLGAVQYVMWEPLPENLFQRIRDTKTERENLGAVRAWLEDNSFEKVDETIELLVKDERLSRAPLLAQSIEAYRRGDYDLAVLGLTSLVDRILSECSGLITDTGINKRVNEIKSKLEMDADSIDDYDLGDYTLIRTYVRALARLGERAPFDGKEPDLNRHWIAHGRMTRRIDKVDCARLVSILYGTLLMNQLAEGATATS